MRFRFLVIALGTMLLATACGGNSKPYLVPVDSKLQPFSPPEEAALTGEKQDLLAPIDDDDDDDDMGDDDDLGDDGDTEVGAPEAAPAPVAPAAAPDAKAPAKQPVTAPKAKTPAKTPKK